uniref:Uncharacterized protein n=1 Tax=Tetraselmis chuii TaxID=63592 RepID=A0A7S1X3D8_9CHLO
MIALLVRIGGLPKLFEIATEADRPEFRALCLDLILDIARAVDMRVKTACLDPPVLLQSLVYTVCGDDASCAETVQCSMIITALMEVDSHRIIDNVFAEDGVMKSIIMRWRACTGPARVWIGRVLASILLEEKGRVLLLKSLKGEDDAEVAAFLRLHINHQFAPENEKGQHNGL